MQSNGDWILKTLLDAQPADVDDALRYVSQHRWLVSARDMSADAALHVAARIGDYNLVYALLEYGAEVDPVNQDGETPLLQVCWGGEAAVSQLPLDHGAETNISDSEGHSPF